jgi:frataxin-like iron-binding protein CyaY
MIWLATANGLARRNGEAFRVFFADNSSNSNDIVQLFKDRESNLWLATYNGIYKLNSQRFLNYTFKDGLLASFIYGIHRDSENQLWIGSRDKGVFRYNNKSFTAFNTSHGLASNRIGPITEFKKQTLIGTNRGLSIFDLNSNRIVKTALSKNIGRKPVNDILIDKATNTQYFAHISSITVHDKNTTNTLELKIPNKGEIWCLWKDSEKNIWIGTYEGGLLRFDQDSNLIDVGEEWGVEIESVMDMVATSTTDLWVATFQGVYHYNTQQKTLRQITVEDGLNSPLVYSLLLDNSNNLWAGTNQGINRIDLQDYHNSNDIISITSFSKADGFVGVECNTHGAWADQNGSLWFGTVNGLIEYIGDIAAQKDIQNKTFITGIKLFYNDTTLKNHSVLSHNNNQISFTFKGICLSNPNKVKYKFKLEGYDQKWSPPVQEKVASYSNLKPGSYTFKVISSNENGTWNRVPTTFSFSIATPFYQQFWFIAIAIFFTGSIVFGLFSLRIKNLKSKATLERNLDNLKLQALRSQMNPHFIFNSLNSIQYYINGNEKKQANRYLTKFAKLMRLILDNSKSPQVTLEKDLEAVQLYVEMEQIRFEGRFEFEVSVDPTVNPTEIQIPPMLIQPYVENCIIHGFTQLKRSGMIKINLNLKGRELLQCIIQDNGIGRKAAQEIKEKKRKIHQSAAMGITQGRLETLQTKYKEELTIKIEDLYHLNEPMGTRVILTIPILNTKN